MNLKCKVFVVEFKMGLPSGQISNRDLLLVILLLCRTIVCDSRCPKFAEKPLETRVEDASIVFRAVVVQEHFQSKTLDLALVSIYRGGVDLASVSQYAGSPYNTTDRTRAKPRGAASHEINAKKAINKGWPASSSGPIQAIEVEVEDTTMLCKTDDIVAVAGWMEVAQNRQVNLTTGALHDCFNWTMSSQSELVVFARVSEPAVDYETTPPDGPWLEATSAAVPWSLGVDIAIWNAVGWAGWGEWGACSRTCGGGKQTRRRYCSQHSCEGYGEQSRVCNSFACEGTINPLAPGARRNFHPAQARWGSVPDRPHAFSLRPNSYIWIASSELFGVGKTFPREFTLFISLRLRPESGGYGQGTLFSLRSRRRTGSFLSLELAGRGAARLVHAGTGSSRSIYLAVPLYDFRWHHIAVSVHDDNTVRAYVDCRWLRTDVLEKDALDTPRDADLIIGYLFSGDLEQLVLVPKAGQAQKQCSSQVTGVANPLVAMTGT